MTDNKAVDDLVSGIDRLGINNGDDAPPHAPPDTPEPPAAAAPNGAAASGLNASAAPYVHPDTPAATPDPKPTRYVHPNARCRPPVEHDAEAAAQAGPVTRGWEAANNARPPPPRPIHVYCNSPYRTKSVQFGCLGRETHADLIDEKTGKCPAGHTITFDHMFCVCGKQVTTRPVNKGDVVCSCRRELSCGVTNSRTVVWH